MDETKMVVNEALQIFFDKKKIVKDKIARRV